MSLNADEVESVPSSYLHNVLGHCGHVFRKDDDDGPGRLPKSLLVFLIRELS